MSKGYYCRAIRRTGMMTTGAGHYETFTTVDQLQTSNVHSSCMDFRALIQSQTLVWNDTRKAVTSTSEICLIPDLVFHDDAVHFLCCESQRLKGIQVGNG